MSPIEFVPSRGTLNARLAENIGLIDRTQLIYDITLPVACTLKMPSETDQAETVTTEVRLDLIRIGLVDWRDLPGRSFTFPVNPAEGYVDGSIYFDNAHQYADLIGLQFGVLTGHTIIADVTIIFNFYKNSALPDLPDVLSVEWKIELDVNADALDSVLANAKSLQDRIAN